VVNFEVEIYVSNGGPETTSKGVERYYERLLGVALK